MTVKSGDLLVKIEQSPLSAPRVLTGYHPKPTSTSAKISMDERAGYHGPVPDARLLENLDR